MNKWLIRAAILWAAVISPIVGRVLVNQADFNPSGVQGSPLARSLSKGLVSVADGSFHGGKSHDHEATLPGIYESWVCGLIDKSRTFSGDGRSSGEMTQGILRLACWLSPSYGPSYLAYVGEAGISKANGLSATRRFLGAARLWIPSQNLDAAMATWESWHLGATSIDKASEKMAQYIQTADDLREKLKKSGLWEKQSLGVRLEYEQERMLVGKIADSLVIIKEKRKDRHFPRLKT